MDSRPAEECASVAARTVHQSERVKRERKRRKECFKVKKERKSEEKKWPKKECQY
jgi:hypothetical protein